MSTSARSESPPQPPLPLDAVALAPGAQLGAGHSVQFFEPTEFPAARVASFLSAALAARGAAAVVAGPPHLEAILLGLRGLGHDTEAQVADGRLALIDAADVLARLAGPDGLNAAAFRQVLVDTLEGLQRHDGPVRIYGELVDLALRAGWPHVTLQVEDVWSGLLGERPFELLCGYTLDGFEGDSGPGIFEQICDGHGDVFPVEDAHRAQPRDANRLAAALQMNRWRGEHQVTRRRQLESEASSAHGRLVVLQAITSSLSEAATPADIARVVLGPMASAVGARATALGVTTDERVTVTLLAATGFEPDAAPTAELQAAFDARSVVWSESAAGTQASLPLDVAGRRWGAVAFAFEPSRAVSPGERAFLEDLACQTALALERARLYDEARRSEARLRDANRRKDEFLAILGHELRNPLAPIMTALQLMKLRGEPASERERAVIERQVHHVSRLVDDLLDVSRITQGKLELRRERVELSVVVAQAIEMAGPLIERRGHRLTVDLPRTGVPVLVDRVRFAQAVSNLLVNAAKFTDPGGRIEVRADASSGERVTLAVSDTGLGIAADVLPTIFDAFVQGRRTLERSHGGLGLGLTLVRSLVRLHGGEVGAHSDGLGCGSRFTIQLPLAEQKALRETAARQAPFAAADLPRRRVLVVDDNQDGADALVDVLLALGHDAVAAYDGPGALELLEDEPFDVAVLDIGLPVMDGYELGRRLRERLPGLRLLAMTGYGMEEDRARSRSAGFEAHFVKPLDYDRLVRLLAEPVSN